MSEILVKKFGGTSLGSLERIRSVASRIERDFRADGLCPVVVASAMSGETNRLIELARQVAPFDRSAAYDMLLASGEQVSISLLAMALNQLGLQARPLLAFQLGFLTNAAHSKASIESIDSERLRVLCDQGIIPVIAGFQGVDSESNVTTLGRGGSDTSAVAIAAALGQSVCEIYTDVEAIYTADPRWVPEARPLARVCFDEMMEMASLGTKVLHARSVELATKYNVQIHLRSTFSDKEGTWVCPEEKLMEKPVVTAVTHDPNVAVLEMYPVSAEPQFLSEVFGDLSEEGVIVDIISQSQTSEGQRLAFSVGAEDLHLAKKSIQSKIVAPSELRVLENRAKISVVGVGMQNQFGVAARFFKALAKAGISVHLVTTSEIKISAVIDSTHLREAAIALHSEFQLEAAH